MLDTSLLYVSGKTNGDYVVLLLEVIPFVSFCMTGTLPGAISVRTALLLDKPSKLTNLTFRGFSHSASREPIHLFLAGTRHFEPLKAIRV